jgi:hypothetical protein
MAFERDGMLAKKNEFIMRQSAILKDAPTPANFARAIVGNVILEGIYFYSAFLVFYTLARNGKMRLAKSFSFQFVSQSKKIAISKIKGIEATRPDAPGWVNLLAIELTASGDKVVVACKVSKLFISLTLNETYSLKEIEALGWKMPA